MTQSLFVAWRSEGPRGGHWGPVARLDRTEWGYRFRYTKGAISLPDFEPFPGMSDLEAVYDSEELFPLFTSRLLARSRPEYASYLAWGGFDPKNPPEPIALLAVTEGRRITDSIEVFPAPSRNGGGRFTQKFFVHGIRHLTNVEQARANSLSPGERLVLKPEPTNPADENALQLLAGEIDGTRVGYIPRYLAEDYRDLATVSGHDALAVSVVRVNHDAPLQQRVLCQLDAAWPETFEPCSKENYQAIGEVATSASRS